MEQWDATTRTTLLVTCHHSSSDYQQHKVCWQGGSFVRRLISSDNFLPLDVDLWYIVIGTDAAAVAWLLLLLARASIAFTFSKKWARWKKKAFVSSRNLGANATKGMNKDQKQYPPCVCVWKEDQTAKFFVRCQNITTLPFPRSSPSIRLEHYSPLIFYSYTVYIWDYIRERKKRAATTWSFFSTE